MAGSNVHQEEECEFEFWLQDSYPHIYIYRF